VSQLPGLPPYPEVMAAALGREARARGADVLVAAGDVSSEGSAVDLGNAKHFLDQFGPYGADYFVTRGNHDRPHTGDAAASCSPSPAAPDHHDCFGDVFFPGRRPWFSQDVFGLRLLGLDTYDKIGTGGDNGVLSDEQWAFVRDQLSQDKDQPTLVAGHHPVTLEASLTTVGVPLGFDMDTQQAMALEQLYAATPGVFLHHSGHTHRNKRTVSTTAPGVVFQEVGAVKEYPGGFHLLRVFTGGYALNFYKFRDELAQEWSERSRPEYLGLAPFYVFGNGADRNSMVERDLSGLTPGPSAAAAPSETGRGTVAAGTLAATGGASGPAVAGAAALAAGLAAETWLRHNR
jgi:Icc protein